VSRRSGGDGLAVCRVGGAFWLCQLPSPCRYGDDAVANCASAACRDGALLTMFAASVQFEVASGRTAFRWTHALQAARSENDLKERHARTSTRNRYMMQSGTPGPG